MSLRVTGRTAAGISVYAGTFQLVDGEGIPLEVILLNLKELGVIHDWYTFAIESLTSGWSQKTIRARAVAACSDVYGVQHADEVGRGLDRVFSTLESMTCRVLPC